MRHHGFFQLDVADEAEIRNVLLLSIAVVDSECHTQ
jgi:hypothetical protein